MIKGTTKAGNQAAIAKVPDQLWAELEVLHNEVTKIRGWTPMHERVAVEEFAAASNKILDEYGVGYWHQALKIGLNGRTISHWMIMHGYIEGAPSLPRYRGVVIER